MVPLPYMEQVSYGPPKCTIPYMECGNLVTVNDLWSPYTLYGMQEPCNCQ